MNNPHPALVLLPNLLGEEANPNQFPIGLEEVVQGLDGLIAESVKGGRRFLGRFKLKKPPHQIPLALLNEHTPDNELSFLLEPIQQKQERWGLVTDAGLPCIADPGSLLVARARKKEIQVEAWPGPSALIMALMLSGLPSQSFTFHGYIEKEEGKRSARIKRMEQEAKQLSRTQVFIETPYRSDALLKSCIESLEESSTLAVGWDLTLPSQQLIVKTVRRWRANEQVVIDKHPAIFLIS